MYLTEQIPVSNIVDLKAGKLPAGIYRSLWQTMAEDTFPIIIHGIFIEVNQKPKSQKVLKYYNYI